MLVLGERRRSAFCTLLRARTGTAPTRPEAGHLSREPAGSIDRHGALHLVADEHLRLNGALREAEKSTQRCVLLLRATGTGPQAGLEGGATTADGATARGRRASY